jgi:hypothetical protein
MTTPTLRSEEKPRSVIGVSLCVVIAAILFPILFVLGWVTASPIYVKREAVELFVGLRDGSYRLLSGRTFKAMILNNPASGSDLKK